MTMTRRDYIEISVAIRNARLPVSAQGAAQVDEARAAIASDIADRAEYTDPEFKRDVFLNACGIASTRVYRTPKAVAP